MKKNLPSFILLFIVLFIGCNRKSPERIDIPSNYINYKTMSDSIGLGDMHNMMMHRYWGFTGDTVLGTGLDYEGVRNIVLTYATFLADDSVFNAADVDSIVDREMTYMTGLGFFDGDDSLKSAKEMDSLMIAGEPNYNIKTAFMNIYNYTGSLENYVDYGLSELAKLNALTSAEQNSINGAGSVLDGSYRLFSLDELNSEAGRRAVILADAYAARAAAIFAPVYFPGNTNLQLSYVYFQSCYISTIAAKNILMH